MKFLPTLVIKHLLQPSARSQPTRSGRLLPLTPLISSGEVQKLQLGGGRAEVELQTPVRRQSPPLGRYLYFTSTKHTLYQFSNRRQPLCWERAAKRSLRSGVSMVLLTIVGSTKIWREVEPQNPTKLHMIFLQDIEFRKLFRSTFQDLAYQSQASSIVPYIFTASHRRGEDIGSPQQVVSVPGRLDHPDGQLSSGSKSRPPSAPPLT